MNIPAEALAKLRRLCADSYGRELTDAELQEVGQRILRYLRNSGEADPGVAGRVDASAPRVLD